MHSGRSRHRWPGPRATTCDGIPCRIGEPDRGALPMRSGNYERPQTGCWRRTAWPLMDSTTASSIFTMTVVAISVKIIPVRHEWESNWS